MTAKITPVEKEILERVYGRQNPGTGVGYVANPIDDVRELEDREKKFFEKGGIVSPHFYVHSLYKVRCAASPILFNRVVRDLIGKAEAFRTNYCDVGTRFVKVVFSPERRINPEIVFRNLSNNLPDMDVFFQRVMEADMRQDFDLQRDLLIRFSVFRMPGDVFVVLVTMPIFLQDAFDSENFFMTLSGFENLKPPGKKSARPVAPDVEESIREYWNKFLTDPPAGGKVPGLKEKSAPEFDRKNYKVSLDKGILSDLRGMASSNRMMMSAIVQAAWGFLLQAVNDVNDVMFCRFIPDDGKSDSGVGMLPVRITSDPNETVENLIDAQFRRLVISHSYSFFNWASSPEIAGKVRSVLDHFFIFRDIEYEQKKFDSVPATNEGALLGRDSWDARSMDFGLTAVYSEKDLTLNFFYDGNSFEEGVGASLGNRLLATLQQMVTDRNLPFKDFIANLRNRLKLSKERYEEEEESRRPDVLNFISKHPILKGEFSGVLQPLSKSSKLFDLLEGDRISGEFLENNLVFVVDGKVVRNVDLGDGWYNALDIMKVGKLLNETVFLKDSRLPMSCEVLTPTATLLAIPLENLDKAMNASPTIARNFAVYCLEQLEKYRRLWIQS